MARLTEQEKQDIVRYLEADKPLPGKVLVCEGESDTWTALSYGFPGNCDASIRQGPISFST